MMLTKALKPLVARTSWCYSGSTLLGPPHLARNNRCKCLAGSELEGHAQQRAPQKGRPLEGDAVSCWQKFPCHLVEVEVFILLVILLFLLIIPFEDTQCRIRELACRRAKLQAFSVVDWGGQAEEAVAGVVHY